MPDITTLILDDHAWFRRQFAALDELQARAGTDTRELVRLWEPLAARLDVHAIAEEKIFYPQLLQHGEDPQEETLDAIDDHNDIRDGVARAGRSPVGSGEWWAGVWDARRANDEHMGEEENEGLANFRLNATVGLRESLGSQFQEFMDAHPTPADLDNSDQDPQAYVAAVENRIDPPSPTTTGLGIGDLKGRQQ
ncbi:hemerythrin domain-containing protein [Pseudonocardia sp. HH130630-07]|uniref:hemerythrin domain-containing protein n=1 Tax=Pseudonocardia sp. HH130630-07 TaxID=1690815 RepID=UPI0008150E89|nr:hemerythrin domain-containing protein [Pseudonocardia sp. HH130630-07]ANY09225.1 cation-binding protein [Pseudonocardia sp. HH130630-07]